MKFTCAVSSIALFINAKDRLIQHAVDYFLVPREFKSVVLSCEPIHHVSLCQLRFFTTECLFNIIVSLSTLSSGLGTLISFSYKVCWQNKSCLKRQNLTIVGQQFLLKLRCVMLRLLLYSMQTIIGLLFTHSIADSSNVIPVFLGEKIIKCCTSACL